MMITAHSEWRPWNARNAGGSLQRSLRWGGGSLPLHKKSRASQLSPSPSCASTGYTQRRLLGFHYVYYDVYDVSMSGGNMNSPTGTVHTCTGGGIIWPHAAFSSVVDNTNYAFTCRFTPCLFSFNPLPSTLKPQCNGPLYSNTVVGTLTDVTVDGWAATFGKARRGLGLRPRPGPSPLYQM